MKRRYIHFSDEESERLMMAIRQQMTRRGLDDDTQLCWETLAAELGIPKGRLWQHYHRVLKKPSAKRLVAWTTESVHQLMHLRAQGLSWKEIGVALNRTAHACAIKHQRERSKAPAQGSAHSMNQYNTGGPTSSAFNNAGIGNVTHIQQDELRAPMWDHYNPMVPTQMHVSHSVHSSQSAHSSHSHSARSAEPAAELLPMYRQRAVGATYQSHTEFHSVATPAYSERDPNRPTYPNGSDGRGQETSNVDLVQLFRVQSDHYRQQQRFDGDLGDAYGSGSGSGSRTSNKRSRGGP